VVRFHPARYGVRGQSQRPKIIGRAPPTLSRAIPEGAPHMLTGNRERLTRVAAGHEKRAANLRVEVKRYERLAFDDEAVAAFGAAGSAPP
jgi:hypothetical protein